LRNVFVDLIIYSFFAFHLGRTVHVWRQRNCSQIIVCCFHYYESGLCWTV